MSLRIGLQRLRANSNNSVMKNMNFNQRRCESVVAGPPKNPLSDLECLILGGGMCVAMLAMPIYTLIHLREYSGKSKD